MNSPGNILKSHGRDYATHTFFRFTGNMASARKLVADLAATYVTSAAAQEVQTANFKAKGDQQLFGALMLSVEGLKYLGFALPAGFGEKKLEPAASPAVSFADPMRNAAQALGDKPDQWDDGYKGKPIHGMLLLAMGKEEDLFNEEAIPTPLLEAARAAGNLIDISGDVAAFEIGQQQRRGGDAVEHFGFIDGISQPILTIPDLPAAAQRTNNDPSAGLGLALVKDPFVGEEDACGSFFVFRKLEQNVALFRAEEEKLAAALGGISSDVAGAMMVGRFQDGTPVVLAGTASGVSSPENNFSYALDAAPRPAFPGKCTFQGHIRKTNPRGDIGRQFSNGSDNAIDGFNQNERARRVVRRGITYGSRDADLTDAPSRDVGLLFQCYQSSIPDQFAFMQSSWANSVDFVRPDSTGQDTIIGQGLRTTAQIWPAPWVSAITREIANQPQLVIEKGGEFFWTPSMPFLEGLSTP